MQYFLSDRLVHAPSAPSATLRRSVPLVMSEVDAVLRRIAKPMLMIDDFAEIS
jgi:hypothetical protein